jgi:hypothetical protein
MHKLLPRARHAFESTQGYTPENHIDVTAQTSRYLQDNLGLPADELQVMGGCGGVLRVRVADNLSSITPPPVGEPSSTIYPFDGISELFEGGQPTYEFAPVDDLRMAQQQFTSPINRWFTDAMNTAVQPSYSHPFGLVEGEHQYT